MKHKVTAAALAICILCGAAFGVSAATEHWNDASRRTMTTDTHLGNVSFEAWANEWDATKTNYQQLALVPGSDESQMNFGWYSQSSGSASVRIGSTADMYGATVIDGTAKAGTVIDGIPYYTNRVTATGLRPATTYYYQYKLDGAWQEVQSFTTADPQKFSLLYVGDPQIGASKAQVPAHFNGGEAQTPDIAARNDAYNWAVTLNTALEQNPNVAFVLSAGDQVNEYAREGVPEKILQQEYEYAGFLAPNALRSLPVATTIGNHDASSAGYKNHFNNPNSFTGTGGTEAGNGHYFTYGNALFIMLNTNNYNAADHRALIDKAVNENPGVTWKIVTIHQDIYGTGLDHSDSDGIILRTQLTPIFDEYGVDVVLQGHDHTYSRSYHLTGDGKQHGSYDKSAVYDESFLADNLCYDITTKTSGEAMQIDPVGTLYISANSATGSKFYELIPVRQDYIATRSQTWTPTYSVIDIEGNTFSIKTYDVVSNTMIDSGYTIVKTK